MTRGLAIEWPAVNALGWIRLAQFAAELPTRIEDATDSEIVVGVPLDPTGEVSQELAVGTEFFVGWTHEHGAIEVPVALVRADYAKVPLWACTAIGEPVETQRRRFVRVTAGFALELELFEQGAPVKASALDLSEGGIRVSIDRWALDPGLRQFTVDLPLPEGMLSLPAQVVWWGNLDENGYRTVGIRFVDLEQKVADDIRRQVFALQLEQRRNR